MTRFIVIRVLRALAVIFALITVTFFITRTFADPARIISGPDATIEQYEQVRTALGMDRPVLVQYTDYVGSLLQGDLGESTWTRSDSLTIILTRIPNTLLLAASALLLGLIVGVPLGFAGARRPHSFMGQLSGGLPVLLVSLADFWVGILLVLVISVELGWLPTSGFGSWEQMILPVITLSLRPIGRTARMVREAVADELSKKYVTAALARGLTFRQVLRKHVIKNVSPTFITMLGYEFVFVFTGYSVLVETVFSWPGVGKLAADSVLHHDVVLTSAVVIVAGVVVAIVNTFVDVSHSLIDKRLALKS